MDIIFLEEGVLCEKSLQLFKKKVTVYFRNNEKQHIEKYGPKTGFDNPELNVLERILNHIIWNKLPKASSI